MGRRSLAAVEELLLAKFRYLLAGALSSHLHLSDPPLTLESLVIDLDVQSKPVQDLFNALVKHHIAKRRESMGPTAQRAPVGPAGRRAQEQLRIQRLRQMVAAGAFARDTDPPASDSNDDQPPDRRRGRAPYQARTVFFPINADPSAPPRRAASPTNISVDGDLHDSDDEHRAELTRQEVQRIRNERPEVSEQLQEALLWHEAREAVTRQEVLTYGTTSAGTRRARAEGRRQTRRDADFNSASEARGAYRVLEGDEPEQSEMLDLEVGAAEFYGARSPGMDILDEVFFPISPNLAPAADLELSPLPYIDVRAPHAEPASSWQPSPDPSIYPPQEPSTLRRSNSLRRTSRRIEPRSPVSRNSTTSLREALLAGPPSDPAPDLPEPEGPFTDFRAWTSRRRQVSREEREAADSSGLEQERQSAEDVDVLGSSSSVAALAETAGRREGARRRPWSTLTAGAAEEVEVAFEA